MSRIFIVTDSIIMSRCVLDSDEFEVVIGWDPALETFFAHVLDKKIDGEDFEKEVFWRGAGERVYREPDELIEAIQPYASRHNRVELARELMKDKRVNSERLYCLSLD
jgi:hypothetical protein